MIQYFYVFASQYGNNNVTIKQYLITRFLYKPDQSDSELFVVLCKQYWNKIIFTNILIDDVFSLQKYTKQT